MVDLINIVLRTPNWFFACMFMSLIFSRSYASYLIVKVYCKFNCLTICLIFDMSNKLLITYLLTYLFLFGLWLTHFTG